MSSKMAWFLFGLILGGGLFWASGTSNHLEPKIASPLLNPLSKPLTQADNASNSPLFKSLAAAAPELGLPDWICTQIKLDFDDGRIDLEEVSRLFKFIASKWPDDGWKFISTLNEGGLAQFGVKGLFLSQVSKRDPELALRMVATSEVTLDKKDLYALGITLFGLGDFSKEQLLGLPSNYQNWIEDAELESRLRYAGRDEMLAKMRSFESTTVKKYDSQGNLETETGGANVARIGRMFDLYSAVTQLPIAEFAQQLQSASWWGDPLETQAAMSGLGRLDATFALEFTDKLSGTVKDFAVMGAFRVAAESNPGAALAFLNKSTDVGKQNQMLSMLAQLTTDHQIASECEQILVERNVPLLWKN